MVDTVVTLHNAIEIESVGCAKRLNLHTKIISNGVQTVFAHPTKHPSLSFRARHGI